MFRAEFPLQWLGECLIHQSILYEGNPDRTNIRERFLYNFEVPKPQEESMSEAAHFPLAEPSPAPALEQPTPTEEPQQEPPVSGPPEVTMAETVDENVVLPAAAADPEPAPIPAVEEAPAVNGIKEEEKGQEPEPEPEQGEGQDQGQEQGQEQRFGQEQEPTRDDDTEMGGTS